MVGMRREVRGELELGVVYSDCIGLLLLLLLVLTSKP